jgi:hypothetical protein
MSNERKRHTSEEKVAILRRHWSIGFRFPLRATNINSYPTMFYRWLKQFVENGAAAFGPPRVRTSMLKRKRCRVRRRM